MKKKWQVTYWDDNKDCSVTVGFDTYEEAVTKQHKVKQKFNRRATIKMKGDK